MEAVKALKMEFVQQRMNVPFSKDQLKKEYLFLFQIKD